jgi:hypothetical protein
MVAYHELHANPEALDTLVAAIEHTTLKAVSDADREAFLINAYNVYVIHQVLRHYPIESVLDVSDFFDQMAFQLEGNRLSLNQLEKEQLMPRYRDPRLHFVLVCGAMGCPALSDRAYRGSTLEAQLQSQTGSALNDPKHVHIGSAGTQIQVSELFSWYAQDFDAAGGAILFINRFRTPPLPANASLSFIPYDWKLNELDTTVRR